MAFQIMYRFNDKKNKIISVAETEEAFQNTTIKELKEKFREKMPGKPGRLFFPV